MCKQLTKEFVDAKRQKMRCCVRFYIWINRQFTELLMFKNKEAELLEIKQRLGAGDVYVPTELEKIMHVEVSELVSKHYDRVEGSEELFRILNNYKFKTKPAKGLLEFTRGYTDEDRLKLRINALDATKDDLVNFAQKHMMSAIESGQSSRVVFGS